MIASILSMLNADLEQSRKAALRRYGELLVAGCAKPGGETAAGATPEAVAELKALMKYLDKSEAEVQADAAIVRTACLHRDRLAALPADQKEQLDAARAKVKAYDAETAELLKTRRRDYFRLYNAAMDIEHRGTKARLGGDELKRMKAAQPELLGAV